MPKAELLGSIKNVAIVYRIGTDKAETVSQKVAAWLKSKGYRPYTAPDQKLIAGTTLMKTPKQWDHIQLVIVLGGDGTYLRAVRFLEGRNVPIIGFNMGSLGFLTIHRADDVLGVLEKTLQGSMVLSPRRMIETKVFRRGKLRQEAHALNDVVIERGSLSQLINISIYCDKLLVADVKADGLIIASPTGSTAYNLAAGGPILDPEAKALIVTSVAPHSLTIRPLIFPEERKLTFKLQGQGIKGLKGSSMKAHFVVDGQKLVEVTPDDEVLIQKSPYDHLAIRSPGFNHYHLLREKLRFGDRS